MAGAPSLTDDEIVSLFLATKTAPTARIYRNTLAQWQAQCPDGFAAATPRAVTTWWATVSQTATPKTRARILYTLRSFYRFGQEVAHWPHNPWRLVDGPQVAEKPPRQILTQAEVTQLFTAAEAEPRALAVLSLLLATGLRLGELAQARWQDVRLSDDQHPVLAISGPHARYVKLIPSVWAALKRYRTALGLPVAFDASDDRPLIWGRSGRAVKPQTITELVAKIAKEAGLTPDQSRVTAMWLRSAHAVWARHAGASPGEIQDALGLKTRQSVDRYLAAAPPIGHTSADVMPEVFPELRERPETQPSSSALKNSVHAPPKI